MSADVAVIQDDTDTPEFLTFEMVLSKTVKHPRQIFGKNNKALTHKLMFQLLIYVFWPMSTAEAENSGPLNCKFSANEDFLLKSAE